MILVNGGTGFIGSSIVKLFAEKGKRVRILSRYPQKGREKLRHDAIELVKGDVRDKQSLLDAMEGADTVINCVQFPNHPVETPSRGWTYMNIDAKGTRLQTEAAKEKDVKHFIYLSGAGAGKGMDYPWFKAKEIAENAVITCGIPYTIFRPSWIYGDEDHSLNKFVSFIKFLPFVPVIGLGKEKIRPVFVKDIAKIVFDSLSNNRAKNKIFEIGGPYDLTMDEIIMTLQRVMGKKRPLLHHPKSFMKLAAFFIQMLPNPPLSPSAVDFVTMEVPVDNSALLDVFSIKLISLEEGLRTYVKC